MYLHFFLCCANRPTLVLHFLKVRVVFYFIFSWAEKYHKSDDEYFCWSRLNHSQATNLKGENLVGWFQIRLIKVVSKSRRVHTPVDSYSLLKIWNMRKIIFKYFFCLNFDTPNKSRPECRRKFVLKPKTSTVERQ